MQININMQYDTSDGSLTGYLDIVTQKGKKTKKFTAEALHIAAQYILDDTRRNEKLNEYVKEIENETNN